MTPCCVTRGGGIGNPKQASAASAQERARAKVDSVVADIKATPGNLQKELKKTGDAAIGEVRNNDNDNKSKGK